MRSHRGSLAWIIGRVGILLVFVIMPLQKSCHRIKSAPGREAYAKTFIYYNEMYKHPVGSEAWHSNFTLAKQWGAIGHSNYVRIYGTNNSK